MSDRTAFLVCLPLSRRPPWRSGSTGDLCSRCHAAVWLAPSSRAVMRRLTFQIVCVDCAKVIATRAKATGQPIEVMPQQPEQAQDDDG